jgi:hypothetical protein
MVRLALIGMLFAVAMHAQQQTGAPAGVPVPAAPPSTVMSVTHEATPGAMTFRIRVLDGRNGMPIRNAHVKLWYDEPAGSGYEFATDLHGVGEMPAPVGEPLRVLASVIDYIDCRKMMRGDPPQAYNLAGIAKSGIATENACGRVSTHTQPGELVLFVRSPRWYEGINRGNSN